MYEYMSGFWAIYLFTVFIRSSYDKLGFLCGLFILFLNQYKKCVFFLYYLVKKIKKNFFFKFTLYFLKKYLLGGANWAYIFSNLHVV